MLSILITIAIAGFVAWLVMQIPMPEPFRKILLGIMCLVLVLWLLQAFGISTGLPRVHLD